MESKFKIGDSIICNDGTGNIHALIFKVEENNFEYFYTIGGFYNQYFVKGDLIPEKYITASPIDIDYDKIIKEFHRIENSKIIPMENK